MARTIGRGGRKVDKLRQIAGREFRRVFQPIERIEVKIFLIVNAAFPRCHHPLSHRLVGRFLRKTRKADNLLKGFAGHGAHNLQAKHALLFIAAHLADTRNADFTAADGLRATGSLCFF